MAKKSEIIIERVYSDDPKDQEIVALFLMKLIGEMLKANAS